MRVVLFAADANENSIGRVYVLWMLARRLNWRVETIATYGTQVWGPLADTEFGRSIRLGLPNREVETIVSVSDVLIGCKPRPESAGRAIRFGRRLGKPVLIDIDDPDFEFQFDFPGQLTRVRRWLRPVRRIGYLRLRRVLNRYAVTTSNPVLQARYGGWVVPHAREDPGEPLPHDGTQVTVAFVGTIHPHKGVSDLREALRLANKGTSANDIRLVATGSRPVDAAEWETWVGETSLSEGARIVRESDIVVIPSRPGGWADAQLPAKLMDAMLAGRAVCVSDVGPLPWAVSDAGEIVPPCDPVRLAAALDRLRDPQTRASLGARARQHALNEFTVDRVAPVFEVAVRQTTSTWERPHA